MQRTLQSNHHQKTPAQPHLLEIRFLRRLTPSVLKTMLVFIALFWMAMIAASWADAAEEEYSFNWLDPDKKIYVLQNRKFEKAKHPLLSVLGGVGISNPYRGSFLVNPRLAFYFTETLGLEGFYTLSSNTENSTYAGLKLASPNALPVVREVRSQYGALLHWAPWYAKINVFNSILYFDWYFTLGGGMLNAQLDKRTNSTSAPTYVTQNLTALYLGTGHLFHLNRYLDFRIDYTSSIFKAPNNGDSGVESLYSNQDFSLGLGLKI
jgi:outer membrane beta-barrel protein